MKKKLVCILFALLLLSGCGAGKDIQIGSYITATVSYDTKHVMDLVDINQEPDKTCGEDIHTYLKPSDEIYPVILLKTDKDAPEEGAKRPEWTYQGHVMRIRHNNPLLFSFDDDLYILKDEKQ